MSQDTPQENTLRKSEEKYRILLENLPQKIFHKDTNSVYISCNKNYADDLKIKPEEIAGKTDYDFYTKELAEKYRSDDKRVIKTGVVEMIEERYVRNGEKCIVQTVKAPIKDKEGNIIGLLGIFWDITDRKKMERKLNKYQKDLRALAVQISSIGEYEREKFATYLHDRIGQSLFILKMRLEMILKSGSLKAKEKDLQEMLNLLNQLIEDTRSLTSELSPPILHQLGLSAGLEWLAEQICERESIMLQFEDDHKPKPVNKNISIMLFRSVHELFINIVKHAKAKNVKLSLKRTGKKIHICVEDDGVGFSAGKIYMPKKASEKFGLFSIKERLAELKGNVKIESEPGRGTRVSLVVPIKDKSMHKSQGTI